MFYFMLSAVFVDMSNMVAIISLFGLALSAMILAATRLWAFEKVVRLAREQALRVVDGEEEKQEFSSVGKGADPEFPMVSIVVTSENDGYRIERSLQALFRQRFESFEVVVANASDEMDKTNLIVKQLQQAEPRLRQTFVPKAHRNIDLHKLALTLGIRAAKAPWVVLMRPDEIPESHDWLVHMASHFTEERDVVLGYSNYQDSLRVPGRRAVFQQAKRFLRQAAAALDGKAVGCGQGNVAFRRDWFLRSGGFIDSLQFPYGECALLVDARAEEGRVAVELHPDARTRRLLPGIACLKEQYRMEDATYRHLQGRRRGVFVKERIAGIAVYSAWLSALLFLVARLSVCFDGQCPPLNGKWDFSMVTPVYELHHLALDAPAFLLIVLLLIAPILSAKRWCAVLNERNFGAYVWCFELLQPWRKSH